MKAKEWFEKSEYQYALDEHDEGGYLGTDENKVAEMLDAYYEYRVKNCLIADVVSMCCDETRKVNQFLKRPSKYCMTCSKELN